MMSLQPSTLQDHTVSYFPKQNLRKRSVYTPPFRKDAFRDTESHHQAQRILRHLAKDVKRHNPHIAVPPAWIQRQLIRSHICGNMQNDWRQAMTWTLTFIKQTASSEDALSSFIDFDSHQALFPNQDGYQLSDLRSFVNACLLFLK